MNSNGPLEIHKLNLSIQIISDIVLLYSLTRPSTTFILANRLFSNSNLELLPTSTAPEYIGCFTSEFFITKSLSLPNITG